MVIHGDNDQIVPLSSSQLYASRLPNARQEIVAKAGHLVELDQPAALADLITTFITA